MQAEEAELAVKDEEAFFEAREKKITLSVTKSIKKQEVDRMVLEKKLMNQRNEQKRHRIIETEQ
jgi:hypothetical protein